MLLNNIYYWAPTVRGEILKTLRQCVEPSGTLVVATALPDGQAFSRHLDMVLRVTQSSHRLPTRDELRDDLRHAGFDEVTVTELIPRSGLAVATAREPPAPNARTRTRGMSQPAPAPNGA